MVSTEQKPFRLIVMRINQELPKGFLRGLLADKTLSTKQVFAAEFNARDVLALCNLCDHPSADLIQRRASLNEARAAIRLSDPRKNAALAMAKTRAGIDKSSSDFWNSKRTAKAQAVDPEETGSELNQRGIAYWYFMQ
jgi:hypothetical protein